MGLTLAQLRAAVILNCQRADKADLIDIALNFGLTEARARHPFAAERAEVPVTLAVDDTSFSLPQGMTNVSDIRVVNTDGFLVHQLRLESKNTLIRQVPSLGRENVSGTPAYGYEEAGVIHFGPKASQEFTMLVTGDITEISLDDDDAGAGIKGIDEALVAYATAYLFRSIQQNEEAGVWESVWERRILNAIRNDKSRSGERRQLEAFPGPPKGFTIDPVKDPFYGTGR